MRSGGTITSVKPARCGEDVPSLISANRSTRSVGTTAFGQKDGTPSIEIPLTLSREFSMFNIIGLVPKAVVPTLRVLRFAEISEGTSSPHRAGFTEVIVPPLLIPTANDGI